MRKSFGTLSLLSLLPSAWSALCLGFFITNGASHLLVSGIAGAILALLLVVADVAIAIAPKGN